MIRDKENRMVTIAEYPELKLLTLYGERLDMHPQTAKALAELDTGKGKRFKTAGELYRDLKIDETN